LSRVLVTGASGFIGRHAVVALRDRGHDVVAVRSRRGVAVNPSEGVTWRSVDLHDQGAARAVVDEVRPDSLLHLAWCAEHGKFWDAPENLTWAGSTLNLLRAFTEAGGRRAVFAGTCAEYRWADLIAPLDERAAAVEPATLYGAAKHGTHEIAAAYARQTGLSIAWGRVFFTFGPGEPTGRLVPSVALRLLEGQVAPVTSGHQVRDFLPVEDLGDAFAALLGSGVEGPVNLASGRGVALREVIAEVAKLVGRPELVEFGAVAQKPGEPHLIVADVGRLADEVGWMPREPLSEGLRRTVAWWERQAARRGAAS